MLEVAISAVYYKIKLIMIKYHSCTPLTLIV